MAFPSGLSVPTHLHREGEEVERRKWAAAAQNKPNQPQWTERTQDGQMTMSAWAENRKTEMVGGEMGWEKAQSETRKGENQGKAGHRGRREGSTPSMHFNTGHSDAMPRVGNSPDHVTGPWPKAAKAKPMVLCS